MRLDLSGPRPRIDLTDASLMLTPAQQRAMDFSTEIAVTAGAGAGKTHTLSLRYTALLLDLAVSAVMKHPSRPRPDIEAVLVLTFTDKASEEMAERCYKRLLALAAAIRSDRARLDERMRPGFGLALAAAVDHLVDTVDLAQISTFHGFCARLLKEFPGESGTPPGFDVLEALVAKDQRRVAAADALKAVIEERPEDLPPLLDSFLGRRWLLDAVVDAMDRRGVIDDTLRRYAADEVTFEHLLATAPLTPEQAFDWCHTEARSLFEQVVALTAPSGGGNLVTEGMVPLLQRYDDPPSEPMEVYRLYTDTLKTVLKEVRGRGREPYKLHTSKVMGYKKLYGDDALYTANKDQLKALQDTLDSWGALWKPSWALPKKSDQTMLTALGAFGRMTLHALELLRERFANDSTLDFAEMQYRATRTVLDDEELRGRLRQRYRYLMVDEFQDTDEQQWRLVQALGRVPGTPADRIFLVGDIKQSIYGFRGGDVTVFHKATKALGVEPLVLPDNFRSKDVLIGWFNAFFGTALGAPSPDRPAWEAPYETLNAGRASAGGSVTLIAHAEKRPTDAAAVEAEALAHLIAAEILPGAGAFADGRYADQEIHPTPPVAILLRTRTHMRVFEDALRRKGVPYIVASGIGFWERPEVVDLVNALHALATQDPLSTAAVLRSPLFGISDDSLNLLATGAFHSADPREHHGLHRFGSVLPDAAPADLVRAANRWRRLLALRDRLPVSTLLREVISSGVGWHLYAIEEPSGQAEANAARLVELSGAMDARGAGGLDDVAAFFLQQVEDNTPETEAAVTPAEARVVLMTAHASKGLEFPVVFVPGMATPPPNITPWIAIRRVASQWDFACRVVDPYGTVQRRVSPGRFNQLEEVRQIEEDAEQLRLLYVAATRSRDHLVLLGADVERDEDARATWMTALSRHHGQPVAPSDGLRVRQAQEVLATPVPAPPERPMPPIPDADATRCVRAVEVDADFEVSPSSLDLFTVCPAQWFLRHLMLIPDVRTGQRNELRTMARVRGDVIHSLLEDDLTDDLAIAKRRWTAAVRTQGAGDDAIRRGWKVLKQHLDNCTTDTSLHRVLDATGVSEVSFRIQRGPVVLRGQIDRLYQDPSSKEWVVLD